MTQPKRMGWALLSVLRNKPSTSAWDQKGHYSSSSCYFLVEVCTHDIYCKSFCPGRGIPPEVSSFFPPLKVLFLIRIEGLRTDGVCTDCKTPWGKFWYWAIQYKSSWLDLMQVCKTLTVNIFRKEKKKTIREVQLRLIVCSISIPRQR